MTSSMLRVFAFVLLAVAVFASPKSTTEVRHESVLLGRVAEARRRRVEIL